MKTTVKWLKNVSFGAKTETGHEIVMDGPAEFGGENAGPRPMEMLLVGLGGCSSFDVLTILQKSRQNPSDCVCEIEAERADAVPAVFTKIHLHFKISGSALRENIVKRAVDMSAEKYCSASIMLAAGGVEISHSYEIIEV